MEIDFDLRERGTLQLFRKEKQLEASKADQAVLAEFDSPYEVLDRAGCIAAEPGLAAVAEKFVGGLRLTADRTGDCRLFTMALAEKAAELGVGFHYGVTIERIGAKDGKVTGIETSGEETGRVTGDAYICAMGPYAPGLLKPIGIELPIYPIKGYSITLPVLDDGAAPQSTIMDETHKVAITRLGDRIRVAGQAEIIGYSKKLGAHDTDAVRHVVSDLFPKGGDLAKAEGWTGLRPMTPDGTPVLGPTRYPNLFLNTGHGTLGWTMACGSGRALADLVTGATPEIDSRRPDGGALWQVSETAAVRPAPMAIPAWPTFTIVWNTAGPIISPFGTCRRSSLGTPRAEERSTSPAAVGARPVF